MDIYGIITTALTLFFGGGWFIYYKANKRIKEGEAAQSEAEGWLKQQEAYHNTIDELTNHCEFIKQDRNLLREENTKLREENVLLRQKIQNMEDQMLEMKKEISRLGRRLEALSKDGRKQRKKTAQ